MSLAENFRTPPDSAVAVGPPEDGTRRGPIFAFPQRRPHISPEELELVIV
jgi:hypothetical protein